MESFWRPSWRPQSRRSLDSARVNIGSADGACAKPDGTGRTSRLTSRASSGDLGCQNCDIFSPAHKSAVRPKPTREMYNLGCAPDLLGSGDMGDALAARFIALHQSLLDQNKKARHMELHPLEDASVATPIAWSSNRGNIPSSWRRPPGHQRPVVFARRQWRQGQEGQRRRKMKRPEQGLEQRRKRQCRLGGLPSKARFRTHRGRRGDRDAHRRPGCPRSPEIADATGMREIAQATGPWGRATG